MTFDRPQGGFTVSEIEHLGVKARCCYNSVEFEVRRMGNSTYLYVFGQLENEERYLNNYLEIRMTEAQMLELARFIGDRMDGFHADDPEGVAE